jgi:hypothetical protein
LPYICIEKVKTKFNKMENNLPKGNDILFKEEVDQNYGSWLQNPANKFFLYSEGYREAGEKLYEYIIGNTFYQNTLVYPLIFNYRHFIELRLKELILLVNRYLDKDNDFADIHNLNTLWETYKKEILPHITDLDSKMVRNVERLINQFTNEDPDSMHFRYPVSKSPSREKHIKRNTLDLRNFKEVMDRLIYFLDWQWDMIAHYQDMKDEMISEMYREYY